MVSPSYDGHRLDELDRGTLWSEDFFLEGGCCSCSAQSILKDFFGELNG